MASLEREALVASLLKKGFVETSGGDHRYFYLWVDGKKTGIHTYVSRGTKYKELGEDLVTAIRKQLKLGTKQQLLDLVACPMGIPEYVQHLMDSGLNVRAKETTSTQPAKRKR